MEHLFIKHLVHNYKGTRNKIYGLGIIITFVKFLIQNGLISTPTIRHYTILNEFDRMVETGEYKNKTQTIQALSTQLGFHENTIWNTLKDHRSKYLNT